MWFNLQRKKLTGQVRGMDSPKELSGDTSMSTEKRQREDLNFENSWKSFKGQVGWNKLSDHIFSIN